MLQSDATFNKSLLVTAQLAHAVTEQTFFDRSTNHEASTKTTNNFEQTSSVTASSYDGTNPEYSTRYVEVPATTGRSLIITFNFICISE